MRWTRGVRRAGWAAAAALCLAAGCGSEEPSAGGLPDDEWPAGELAAATPIRVGWVPDGHTLDIAEEGARPPLLSDDTSGTVEPSLLLAPDGWDGSLSGVIAVAAVDCAGMQGGCVQALGIGESYSGGAAAVPFELDGRPATYREGAADGRPRTWPQVTLELPDVDPARESADGDGPTWALRVSSPTASRELLTEVLAAASLDDDRLPVVADVPDGWQVVSRTTAAQLDAADGHVVRWRDGTVAADGYVLAWDGPAAGGSGERPRLTVVSVDGSEANLAALAALRMQASTAFGELEQIEEVEVGGRTGWVSEATDSTAVVVALDGGGIAAVEASGDDRIPLDQVLRVAESIEEIDEPSWQSMVEELNGGPGLRPQPGRRELARGTVDGTEWLLQGARPDSPADLQQVPGIDGASLPNGCILLGDGRRVCAGRTSGGGLGTSPFTRTYYDRDARSRPASEGPVFVVGLAGPEVAAVRVERPGGAEVVETRALPDSTARLYVLAFAPGEQGAPLVHLDADGQPLPP